MGGPFSPATPSSLPPSPPRQQLPFLHPQTCFWAGATRSMLLTLSHSTARHAAKATPPCPSPAPEWGTLLVLASLGRESHGLRGGTTLSHALGSGGKVPDQRSATITPGLCKPGKVHGVQGEQGQAEGRGSAWGSGQRSPSHSALGTSVNSKEVFAVASLLSCPSCCLPQPTEHVGLTSGDSCPKHFSSCEKGPPERLGKYLLLPAVNTSAVNCKVSLVLLQAA